MIDYEPLPAHLREGMKRYIEHGIEPGSFMRLALENDFVEAAGRADPVTAANLCNIARFISLLPREMWGSRARVEAWIEGEKAKRAGNS